MKTFSIKQQKSTDFFSEANASIVEATVPGFEANASCTETKDSAVEAGVPGFEATASTIP